MRKTGSIMLLLKYWSDWQKKQGQYITVRCERCIDEHDKFQNEIFEEKKFPSSKFCDIQYITNYDHR